MLRSAWLPVHGISRGCLLLLLWFGLGLSGCKHLDSNAHLKLKPGLPELLNLAADPQMALQVCTEQLFFVFVGNAESLGDVVIPPQLTGLFGADLLANWQIAETHRKIEYFTYVKGQYKALINALAKVEAGCLNNPAVVSAWQRDQSYGSITLFSIVDGPNVRLNTDKGAYEDVAADSVMASWRFYFAPGSGQTPTWTLQAPLYWSFKNGALAPVPQAPAVLNAVDLATAAEAIDHQETLPIQQEFFMPDVVDALLASVKDPQFLQQYAGTSKISRYIYVMKGHGGLVSDYEGLDTQAVSAVNDAQVAMASKGSVFLFDPHGPDGVVKTTDFYSPLWDPEAICRAEYRGQTLGAVLACQNGIRQSSYDLAKKAAVADALSVQPNPDPLIGHLSVTTNGPLSGFEKAGQDSLAIPAQASIASTAGSGGQGSPTEGQGSPTEGQGSPTEGQGSPTEGQGSPTEGQGSPTEGQGSPTEGQGLDGLTLGEGFWRGGAQGAKTLVCSSRSDATYYSTSSSPYKHPLSLAMVASDQRNPISGQLLSGDIRMTSAPMAYRFMGKAKAISQLKLADPMTLIGSDLSSLVIFDTCYANMAPLELNKAVPWVNVKGAGNPSNWVVLANPIPVLDDALNYGMLTGFQYSYLTELLKTGIPASAGPAAAAPAAAPSAIPPPAAPPSLMLDDVAASAASSVPDSPSRTQAAQAIDLLLAESSSTTDQPVDDSVRKRRLHAYLFDCSATGTCNVTTATSNVAAYDQLANISGTLLSVIADVRKSRQWFDPRLIEGLSDYGASLASLAEYWIAHDPKITPQQVKQARIGAQVMQRLARFSYSFDVPEPNQNLFLELLGRYFKRAESSLSQFRADSSPAPLFMRPELFAVGIMHYTFTARNFLQSGNSAIFTGQDKPYDETVYTMTPYRPVSDLLGILVGADSADLRAIAPSPQVLADLIAAEQAKDLMKQFNLLANYMVTNWRPLL